MSDEIMTSMRFADGERYPQAVHVRVGDCEWAKYASMSEVAEVVQVRDELRDENDALRALVADMWFWSYEGHMDGETQEWQMEHMDDVITRMRRLGVEVR